MTAHRPTHTDSDSGAVVVLVAVMLVVLLGMGAFAVDAGALYAERRQLQTAADAGALAGVTELPARPGDALRIAQEYAAANTAGADQVRFDIVQTYAPNDTIIAHVDESAMRLFFARFLGMESAPVGATATAVVASPYSYASGVMPMGVMRADYLYGDIVTLKQNPPNGTSGNLGFLDLVGDELEVGGGSPQITGPIASGGVDEAVAIGEQYCTQTGINGRQVERALETLIGSDSCTFSEVVAPPDQDGTVQILDEGCPRLIICPIVENVDGSTVWPSGQSDPIEIVGFAYFFISGWGVQGTECWIEGTFVRPVRPDELVTTWGAVDPYGAISYRLVD